MFPVHQSCGDECFPDYSNPLEGDGKKLYGAEWGVKNSLTSTKLGKLGASLPLALLVAAVFAMFAMARQ